MITRIFNVDSTKGSGLITFGVRVDAAGANETVSTNIGGQIFSTEVTSANARQEIRHTKAGLHMLVLRAQTSNVSSEPVLLDL